MSALLKTIRYQRAYAERRGIMPDGVLLTEDQVSAIAAECGFPYVVDTRSVLTFEGLRIVLTDASVETPRMIFAPVEA